MVEFPSIEIIDISPEHSIFFPKEEPKDRSHGLNARLSPLTTTAGIAAICYGLYANGPDFVKIGAAAALIGMVGIYDKFHGKQEVSEEVVYEAPSVDNSETSGLI